MDSVAFDINDALKHYMSDPASIPTPEADGSLFDCENDPEGLTNGVVNPVLNPIVDAVAENPEAITRSAHLDSLQFLLKCAPISPCPSDPSPSIPLSSSRLSAKQRRDSERMNPSRYTTFLPTHALSKIFDLIMSGLAAEADAINHDLESPDEQETLAHHKQLLEIYGFLLQWTIAAVETKAAEKSTTAPVARGRGKPKKNAPKGQDGVWDSASQLQSALDIMSKVLKLKLSKIFLTTSERDTFVGLLTRPVYMVLESEQRVKAISIRMHAFKVLCIAVKHHGHAYAAQISIVQNLTYFEHLSEPMAEFLHILAETYDYPQLADEILRELSNKEFNSNDTKGPKSVSQFIVKLSELAPRIVIKQMTMLAKQLDSESYTLRCSLIEVCGNMVAHLVKQDERGENHKSQLDAFFDVLEERFLDINPYCRCRAIQVYVKLCDLEQKFPKRRQRAAELACRSLEDKSSHVRRNAIKLLGTLIKTHPFTALHGALLVRKDWQARLDKVEEELNALKPPEGAGLGDNTAVDNTLLDDATQVEQSPQKPMTDEQKFEAVKKAREEAATSEAIEKLTLTKRYYSEALKFIDVLHDATGTVCQLLGSRNKSEVIEAMDYFEIGDAYKIEQNKVGIRRMLRLIWTKGNSDEGKGVQSHLIDVYKRIFFEAPGNFTANDAANYIARNMISLTSETTPAELTSLEQLLATMMKGGLIPELVIAKLWQVYGVRKREISRKQRRGAIIVLGMLATANPEIVVGEMETMLRTGLGAHGRADLQLAKYTCIALRRINPTGRQAKESTVKFSRLPNEHAVLARLAAITEVPSDSKEWYGVAEQAINAIYAISKHPDILCSEIIRHKTKRVFAAPSSRPVSRDERPSSRDEMASQSSRSESKEPDVDDDASDGNETVVPPPKKRDNAIALSQLLFIVGHVAIKQIVHLELCELDFKRRKQDQEKEKTAEKAAQAAGKKDEPDDLDLIGGTTEDDFTEAMAHIRERELLYGPASLLAQFGPLVSEICANNTTYADKGLQAAATLCLAKLMCVSSEYCEANLPLLITIMERSTDATVRSNAVIALGDMAVCFNHLIDENTDFLYRRLADKDQSVKRTCLMTLTFLILAGQVKVKGQLGEMAKCLEDEDRRIADLARMFFTELSTKDNAVYNHFVDMFSLLSAEKGLEEESFRRIIRFLLGFVEKDKHAKQLADKLAARLQRCETERQWNDVAFALGLLQHKNEEITKTVSEGFKVVQLAAARSITPYSKLLAQSAPGTPQNDAIIYASNGTTTLSSNGTAASVVVLDFGRNVEGIPTFEVVSASGDTSVFEISYGETEAALSVYMSDGPLPLAAAMDTYRVNRYNVTGPSIVNNRLIQGTFRYQKLNLSTSGALTLRNIGVKPTTSTTALTQLPGSFECSDEDLTRIWSVGARTVQLTEIPKNSIPDFLNVTEEGAYAESAAPQALGSAVAAQLLKYRLDFRVKPVKGGFGFSVLSDTLNSAIYISFDLDKRSITAHTGSTALDTQIAAADIPANLTLALGSWHSVHATVDITEVSVSVNNIDVLKLSQSARFFGSFGFGASLGHAAYFQNITATTPTGDVIYTHPLTDRSFLADFFMGANPADTIVDGSRRDRIAYSGDLDIAVGAAFASTFGTSFIDGSLDLIGSYQVTPGFFTPTAKIQQEPLSTPLDVNVTGLIGYSFNFLTAIAQNYEMRGNLTFAQTWAPKVVKMLDWADSQTLPNGLFNLAQESFGGDWNYYDPPQSGVVTKFNVFYAYSLQQCLRLLEDASVDVAVYQTRLDRLRAAINENLWSEELGVYIMSEKFTNGFSQDANALAILAGVPGAPTNGSSAPFRSASSILSAMASGLAAPAGALAFSNSTVAAGWAQKVSPYAAAYHLRAALESGDASSAMMLLKKTWAPMANPSNANYTGSFWETLNADGTPGLGLVTSLCHGWAAGPTAELSKHVLGVQPTAPGFAEWKIEPQTLGLEWAKGRMPTVLGDMTVDWRFEGGLLRMKVESPAGANKGTVYLPQPLLTPLEKTAIRVNGVVLNGTHFEVQGGDKFELTQDLLG
ncbi:condensin complex component cnd1 [Colletotrichum chrysophilum]|uniref:Condensin complex component cnd1 n=1 Tax=Colletotrichum chrysophilum TaxID=1836956 RepID=A0AAD9EAE3_9PEZI|nr:condensin complex component cnd1 [Colletotrichum chrysophilum]